MNTGGISSNALFGNTANNYLNCNLSLDAKHLIFSADYHFVFVYAKIT